MAERDGIDEAVVAGQVAVRMPGVGSGSGSRVYRAVATADRVLAGAVAVVLAAVLVGDMLLVLASVIARSFFDYGLTWTEELSRLALVILAFLGGAVAYRDGMFPALQVVADRLPTRLRAVQSIVADVLVVGTAAAACWISVPLLEEQWAARTLSLQISAGWLVLPLTVGMALFIAFGLARLALQPLRTVAVSALSVAALVTLAVATREFWAPSSGAATLWLVLIGGAVLLLGGMPIAFVLTVASLAYLVIPGEIPLVAFATNMQHGVDDFLLLAIPFFVLAGLILDAGGVSQRLIDFARVLVGRFRGGLLQVVIATMYLFSGLSGSETADISAVGSATARQMRARGYPPGETAAVLASSAAMGITVPPSIAALVLASVSSISVGALFAAGIIPAAVLGLALMAVVALRAPALGVPADDRSSAKQVAIATFRVLPALGMVVVLAGGILAGIATPTEVSTFGVVYGLLLSGVVYRSLSPRGLWDSITATTSLVGMVLFMISAASAFAWVLAVNQIPQRLGDAVAGIPGGSVPFLALSIVLVMVMGALFEGIPALLILAPLLLPTAVELGIDPVHYGVVLIFSMGIGAFSPPIGVGFLVACTVSGARVEEGMRRYFVYFAALVAGTVVIAAVPQLTLFVPRLLGL